MARAALRVMVVEDQAIVRDGIVGLLTRLGSHEIVATVADGRRAVAECPRLAPDVVVMDLMMPELNGIEATRQIVEARPDTKVVILSGYDATQYVVEAFRAGAAAYILKDCVPDELIDVIEAVASGERDIVKGIDMVAGPSRPGPAKTVFSTVTPREREVLQLYAEGNHTKAIAAKLGLSPKTVESHRARLYAKLRCSSPVGLTHIAIREGLVQAGDAGRIVPKPPDPSDS